MYVSVSLNTGEKNEVSSLAVFMRSFQGQGDAGRKQGEGEEGTLTDLTWGKLHQ